jgi:hypothetical protein
MAALLVMGASCAGCITLPRTSFTQAEQALASPAGFGKIRYAADDAALALVLRTSLKPDAKGEIDALALSGGGANGAYGAGVLKGWTTSGQRPEFQLVTGISAGALTAPFAFLGPAWDERLRQAFFAPEAAHLVQGRGPLGLLTPGLYRKAPLEDLVRGYVTDEMIRAIAEEHAKGRRLLVGTTDLDTEQLIVWDMGAIAAKGGAEARDLFGTVLIASASVPGVFSPTMIRVEGGGRTLSEMHVDGETESAFFAIPQALFLARALPPSPFHAHLFIIINGQLDNQFAITPRSSIPILRRALDAGGKASIRSAIITSAEFCRQNDCEVSVLSLPPTVKDDSLDYDAAHLENLYAAGAAAFSEGSGWKSAEIAAKAGLAANP